jgi:hypothetical protein
MIKFLEFLEPLSSFSGRIQLHGDIYITWRKRSAILSITNFRISLIYGAFERGVLRRIFGPKTDDNRRRDNEELHSLYSSPSIIRMIKSRRMRLAGHVARTGRRTYAGFL